MKMAETWEIGIKRINLVNDGEVELPDGAVPLNITTSEALINEADLHYLVKKESSNKDEGLHALSPEQISKATGQDIEEIKQRQADIAENQRALGGETDDK